MDARAREVMEAMGFEVTECGACSSGVRAVAAAGLFHDVERARRKLRALGVDADVAGVCTGGEQLATVVFDVWGPDLVPVTVDDAAPGSLAPAGEE